jgi:hypothetical protein
MGIILYRDKVSIPIVSLMGSIFDARKPKTPIYFGCIHAQIMISYEKYQIKN